MQPVSKHKLFSRKMSEFVTLRAVAKKAGVSHTTVSLALRGDPRILPVTRKRVARVAESMGYKRDAGLSTLMSHLRNIRKKPVKASLGFVTAWPTRDGWQVSANHRRFFSGVQARANELGYGLDEVWLLQPGMTAGRMTKILRSRGIRGLILQSLPNAGGRLSLSWDHFACVTKGLTVAEPALHRVTSWHYEDMRMVFSEVTKYGYRRVGLVLSAALNDRVDHAWVAAYYVFQNNLPAEDRVVPLLLEKGAGLDAFAKWYYLTRPQVILFSDQPVPKWIAHLGLRIPDDVGIASLDLSPELAPMSGLDSEPESLGIAAVDLLVGQLQAYEYGIPKHEKVISIKGTWIKGKTLRDIRPRKSFYRKM